MKRLLQKLWLKTSEDKYLSLLLAGSFGALLASVTYTSYKSAIANQYVADTLADNYMFMGANGLDQVVAPGTHTYLLKWPMFILHNAIGFNFATYALVCIGLALATYFGSLYFIYKVAPNVRILAGAALTLALIVFLTKPYPTDASFSLVGIAMPTIRNIEYIIYFIFLGLLTRLTGFNKRFWWSAFLFAVLAASDPFFAYLGIGGTVFLWLLRALRDKKITWQQPEALMLANTIVGAIIGQILLRIIDITKIVDISTFKASPHPFVANIQEFWNAVIGAVQGTLINFGGDFFGMPMGGKTLPVLFNATVAIACIAVAVKIVRATPAKKITTPDQQRRNFVLLGIFSTVIAYLALVLSSHDGVEFVGGIRYIYIAVFTGLFALAYFIYQRGWHKPNRPFGIYMVLVGLFFLLAVPTAKAQQAHAFEQQQRNFADRQYAVLDLLRENNVQAVFGDFWSIYPIKFIGENKYPGYTLTAVPIEGCNSPKPYFVNKEWYKPSQSTRRTALYVERDALSADIFHGCALTDYYRTYGTPSKVIPVRTQQDGTVLDVIMVFDYDIRVKIGAPQASSL